MEEGVIFGINFSAFMQRVRTAFPEDVRQRAYRGDTVPCSSCGLQLGAEPFMATATLDEQRCLHTMGHYAHMACFKHPDCL